VTRFAVTVPLRGIALGDHAATLAALAAAGYTDFWTQEVRGFDALTPLAALGRRRPRRGSARRSRECSVAARRCSQWRPPP